MYKNWSTHLTTALVIALGVLALGAGVAQAYEGPVWSIGENEITEAKVIKSKSSGITFEDTSFAIECKLSAEGKLGALGKNEVTSVSITECKSIKGCTGTITAKALSLPWHAQLGEVEEKLRNTLSPDLSFECTILGLKVKDECVGETSAAVENVTGGADLVFESKSAHLKCSVGGTGTGIVKGIVLDENTTEQLRGDNRVDAFVGATPVGPGKPFVFAAGETAKNLILRNKAAIRRQFLNGFDNVPGVVTVNPTNFTLMSFPAKACGEALAGGAECEIVIKSAAATETGEYKLEYGPVADPLENKFVLMS